MNNFKQFNKLCLYTLFMFFSFFVFFLQPSFAQEEPVNYIDPIEQRYKAVVIDVTELGKTTIPGLDISTESQLLNAKILSGPRENEIVEFENQYLMLEEDDKFFINYIKTVNGEEMYSVNEPDRTIAIFLLLALFVIAVIIFGGWQGVRSLMSLAFSFFIIFQFLFPSILAGHPPLFMATIISILIMIFAILVTHGVNRKSVAALCGSIIAILITIIIAEFAVDIMRISGFGEEATTYLNANTYGIIDIKGLFLAAVIIGTLGILDDIAITQASAVHQFNKLAPNLSKKELYFKALHIGKDHFSATLNTLALAYAGAALPMLLLFAHQNMDMLLTINREVFAPEIVRTLCGSMAIILTVPITTIIAIFFEKSKKGNHTINK